MSAASTNERTEAPVRRIAAERGIAAGIEYLRWRGRTDASGVPVILLHGIGSNASSWTRLAAAVAGAHELIAWNAPGYAGSSPLFMTTPRPGDYAHALDEMLAVLGVETMILVGHSLGALFAGAYAAAWPQKIRALGLLSLAVGYAVEIGAALPPKVQSRLDDLARQGPEAFARARAPRLMGDPTSQPDVIMEIQTTMAAVKQPGYGHATRALAAGDLAADAARLSMPTLVGVGARDLITTPDSSRAIYARLPKPAGYFEFADIGHALPQEAPTQAAMLLDRLEREAGLASEGTTPKQEVAGQPSIAPTGASLRGA